MILHTAGSFGLEVFAACSRISCGVLYPFQSFSPGRETDISRVPFLIEGSDNKVLEVTEALAKTLSPDVYSVNTEKRKLVHLAGVFVNNFVNHFYSIGEELVNRAGLPADILGPLAEETREKALLLGAEEAQTGPAFRNDINTIEKHLELLSFSTDLSDIYSLISDSIIKKFSE